MFHSVRTAARYRPHPTDHPRTARTAVPSCSWIRRVETKCRAHQRRERAHAFSHGKASHPLQQHRASVPAGSCWCSRTPSAHRRFWQHAVPPALLCSRPPPKPKPIAPALDGAFAVLSRRCHQSKSRPGTSHSRTHCRCSGPARHCQSPLRTARPFRVLLPRGQASHLPQQRLEVNVLGCVGRHPRTSRFSVCNGCLPMALCLAWTVIPLDF